MTASRITSTVDFDKNGRQTGFLRLPHSVHESAYGWIPIPIVCLKNGSGPTVLLNAGNHGDEYEGQVTLMKLIRELKPEQVQGRIIFNPASNFPAAMAGRRTSPIDGGNLNRSFPGDPDGTVTQQIAWYISSELLPLCDAVVDLHSGGSSLMYVPSVLARRPHQDERGGQVHECRDDGHAQAEADPLERLRVHEAIDRRPRDARRGDEDQPTFEAAREVLRLAVAVGVIRVGRAGRQREHPQRHQGTGQVDERLERVREQADDAHERHLGDGGQSP